MALIPCDHRRARILPRILYIPVGDLWCRFLAPLLGVRP